MEQDHSHVGLSSEPFPDTGLSSSSDASQKNGIYMYNNYVQLLFLFPFSVFLALYKSGIPSMGQN